MTDKAAIMYSGGVDSTLVASKVASKAKHVYLITCLSHCHVPPSDKLKTPENMMPRIALLKQKHPHTRFTHVLLHTNKLQEYLWKKSRISELIRFGLWRNFPCSTCFPANITSALVYCIKNGIRDVYWGGNVMMAVYPGQNPACGPLLEKFAKGFGITIHSPVFWYQNEDTMLLYQFEDFRNDPIIQNNILWGKTTTKESNNLGLEVGDIKFDFDKKDRYQVTCIQDAFVAYSHFFYFYPVYGFKKIEKTMLKQLESQLKTLEQVVECHLEKGQYEELF